MLERARQGEFAAICAYSNSRLTRRPQEYNELIDIAVKYKVRICTVASGEFNMDTADGRAVARTIAAWDAAESDRVSERVKASIDQRRAAGRFHGGPVPWGYRLENKKLYIVPEEAKLIRSAIDRVIRGDTFRAIARDWNRDGVRPRNAVQWNGNMLRDKIKRPAVIGRNTGGVLGWEPIVDEATYAKLLAVMATRGYTGPHEATTMGSGLAFCGTCGRRLVLATGRPYRMLGCLGGQPLGSLDGPDRRASPNGLSCGHMRIENERLERYVFGQVLSQIATGTIAPRLRTPANFATVSRLDEELARLRIQKLRLDDLRIRGDVDETEHRTHSKRLRQSLESATARVDAILGTAQFAENLKFGLDWQKWTPVRRAHFLKAVIERVDVLTVKGEGRRFPIRRRDMSQETWEQVRGAYVEATLPARVRIVYWAAAEPTASTERAPVVDEGHSSRPRLYLDATSELSAAPERAAEGDGDGVEGWVGVEQVAAHLGGISPLTVLNWRKQGKLSAIKPGKRWLFRISDVDAELTQHAGNLGTPNPH